MLEPVESQRIELCGPILQKSAAPCADPIFNWLRNSDLNRDLQGYEPCALPLSYPASSTVFRLTSGCEVPPPAPPAPKAGVLLLNYIPLCQSGA